MRSFIPTSHIHHLKYATPASTKNSEMKIWFEGKQKPLSYSVLTVMLYDKCLVWLDTCAFNFNDLG